MRSLILSLRTPQKEVLSMKKRHLIALLLVAVIALGGFLYMRTPAGSLLENDEEPLQDDEVFLEDEDVPLSDLPTDLPAEEEPAEEEEPFEGLSDAQIKMIEDVYAQVNKERVKAGLPELKLNYTLCKAAQVRAEECVKHFSHTRPNGTKFRTAIEEAGIQSSYTGENVASGYTSASHVMKGWMASPGHKENILRDKFNEIGIGVIKNSGNGYGGYSWCQLFIK